MLNMFGLILFGVFLFDFSESLRVSVVDIKDVKSVANKYGDIYKDHWGRKYYLRESKNIFDTKHNDGNYWCKKWQYNKEDIWKYCPSDYACTTLTWNDVQRRVNPTTVDYDTLMENCPRECASTGYNAWMVQKWDWGGYRCQCSMVMSKLIEPDLRINNRGEEIYNEGMYKYIPKSRGFCSPEEIGWGWGRTFGTGEFSCPKGTEHALLNNNVWACGQCNKGKYQETRNYADVVNTGWCQDCVSGYRDADEYGDDFGSLKRHWAKNIWTQDCKKCPSGYYQGQYGQVSCKKCRFGFKSRRGAHECSDLICDDSIEQPQSYGLNSVQKRLLKSDKQYRTIYDSWERERFPAKNVIYNDDETEIIKYRHNSNGNYRTIRNWYDPTKIYHSSTDNADSQEIEWRLKGGNFMNFNEEKCGKCASGTYPTMRPLVSTKQKFPQEAWRNYNFLEKLIYITAEDFSSATYCYIEARRFGKVNWRIGGYYRDISGDRTYVPVSYQNFYWIRDVKEYCKKTQITCQQCPTGKTGNGWHCDYADFECDTYELSKIDDNGGVKCETCPAGKFTFPSNDYWAKYILQNSALETSVDRDYLQYYFNVTSPMDYKLWTSNNPLKYKHLAYLNWLDVYGNLPADKKSYIAWLKRTSQSGLEHYYLDWLKSQTNGVNHASYNRIPSMMCFGCPIGKTNNGGSPQSRTSTDWDFTGVYVENEQTPGVNSIASFTPPEIFQICGGQISFTTTADKNTYDTIGESYSERDSGNTYDVEIRIEYNSMFQQEKHEVASQIHSDYWSGSSSHTNIRQYLSKNIDPVKTTMKLSVVWYNAYGGKFAISNLKFKTNECVVDGMQSCILNATECPLNQITHGGQCVDAPECPAGYYVDVARWVPCPAGKYKESAGNTSCLDCSTGTYQNDIGQVECKICPVGTYQNDTGQPECKICPGGRHSMETKVECAECEYSTFSSDGAVSCTSCPTGFYGIGAADHFNMSKTYGVWKAFQTVKKDDIGGPNNTVFQDGEPVPDTIESGWTTCRECEPGRTTANALSVLPSCGHHNSKTEICACTDMVVCKANYTCDTTRGCVSNDDFIAAPTREDVEKEVLVIINGWWDDTLRNIESRVRDRWVDNWLKIRYQTWARKIANLKWMKSTHYCHECPLNTYTGKGTTIVRPDGNLFVPDGGICVRCPKGRYNNETGQTECRKCSPGKFGKYEGSDNVCVECPLGKYQDNTEQIECKTCPNGKKGGSEGSTTESDCEKCPWGKYSASSGATCENCEDGKSTDYYSEIFCSPCFPGKYSVNGSRCTFCPAGQFQEDYGKAACKECPNGYNTNKFAWKPRLTGWRNRRFSPNTYKNTQCYECPRNQYSLEGFTECKRCPLGKTGTESGQSNCPACPQGKRGRYSGDIYGPEHGSGGNMCQDCGSGMYQDQLEQIECKACELGKYVEKQGHTVCKTCPNGFTTSTFGLRRCSKCNPGYVGWGQGLCHACNNAEYQDEYGKVECKLCPGGQFAPTATAPGQTECQTCPSGYYGWNKYTHPVEYKLINTNYWMRNCDACPIKNYLGHGGCSVTTKTTMSACREAGGRWTFYRKCEDIPGNEVWDTTIRTKYECRDAWLNFLENDEKEELLEDGTFSWTFDKYKPICSYRPGLKCNPSTCSDPNQKWKVPPRIFWNPKSLMTDKNIRKASHRHWLYGYLDGDMAVCKVRVKSTQVPYHQIDYTGIQCHQCPSGQFSTKEGLTVHRDINNKVVSNRCTNCQYEDKCTRCDWGRYSRPDRIFGETTYEEYMMEKYGEDRTQWPPEEQYYCSTCPAGWDSYARTFTWKQGTEFEYDAMNECSRCEPGTYSRFVETNEYEHDLGKYGRYKGHSGYIVVSDQSNEATSVNDYDKLWRYNDYFLNKNIVLGQTGCSMCDGEGEYQDEFEQSSCKTCSAAGLEATPLDDVMDHLKEYIECVETGKYYPFPDTVHNSSYTGYDCYKVTNYNLDNAYMNWQDKITAHSMKWIKCRNATSVLAPWWRAGSSGVWDKYFDSASHPDGYKFNGTISYGGKYLLNRARNTAAKRLNSHHPAKLMSTIENTPAVEDTCSLSYIYSDSRVGNMTKEELMDAMKEISSVLLRRGASTDILPFDIPMFSVKNLYNSQGTCSEGDICNNIDLESFTCSDTGIGGQTIPVTGLSRNKLTSLFTCGDPMANICQNSTLNLTTWECI